MIHCCTLLPLTSRRSVVPRRLYPVLLLLSGLLSALPLFSGCAGTPARTPARPGPSLEVQSRLLQHARAAHGQSQYETAIRLLRRLIEMYPQSPFLLEARWWLARSHEQAGELDAALAQYRLVAQTALEPRATEARTRIAELDRILGTSTVGSAGLTAILIRAEHLPTLPIADAWLQGLTRAGVTTLVVEAGTRQPRPRAGVYFQTNLAVVVRDAFGPLVPVAHRNGLSVFAALTLRRMDWLDPQLGWADWVYDPTRAELQRSRDLDLFNPAFQEYLVALLTDLVRTGVDGVLFQADAPLGPTEGLSPFALRGFERDFGIKLEPARLYVRSDQNEASTVPGAAQAVEVPRAQYAPEFWRWAGWKAREVLKVVQRLTRAMRAQAPKLRFALELHPESVTGPVDALVQYGEDLLEAKRVRFDYFLVASPPASGAVISGTPTGPGAGATLATQMVRLIGEKERVWISVPLPDGELAQLSDRLTPMLDRASLGSRIGLIYMGNRLPVP